MTASAGRKEFERRQFNSVLVVGLLGRGDRVGDLHGDTDALKLAQNIDHLRIADVGNVLLKRHSEDRHGGIGAATLQQSAHAFPSDALSHAVIDAASGENDLRMIAGLLGPECEIIRIDADAVTADQPRLEVQEIPFGRRRSQHIAGVDAELVKNRGQLVHERDVEIALRVFDDFGSLGHLDRRCAMDSGFHHRTVDGTRRYRACGDPARKRLL